jgi:hypothetical protein
MASAAFMLTARAQAGNIEQDAKQYGNQFAITLSDALQSGYQLTGKSILPMIWKEAVKEGYTSKAEQVRFADIALREAIRESQIINPVN